MGNVSVVKVTSKISGFMDLRIQYRKNTVSAQWRWPQRGASGEFGYVGKIVHRELGEEAIVVILVRDDGGLN